jgi:putative serine protease PepD
MNATRKTVAVVAAALVLMIGSGAVGGWAASRGDDSASPGPAKIELPAHLSGHASLAPVVQAVEPSVVSIRTQTGEGSGVVLDTDGHVLTNNHVVATAEGDTVTVTFDDGSSHHGTIVGTDPRSDLAVVQVHGASGLVPATLGNSATTRVGDSVLAIGSPLGLQDSVTEGIVSAKDRTISETDQAEPMSSTVTSISGLLQTDAAINPGNSGGALVNAAGQVIGVNTAIATAGGSEGNIGVGFAIPSDTAKYVAHRLIEGQPIAHPYLGVGLAESGTPGALVESVRPASPAARADLEPGDLITKLDDQAIRSADDLVAAVQSHRVGQTATLTYTRAGAEHTATVTLADAP